jgi:hypothetical protein
LSNGQRCGEVGLGGRDELAGEGAIWERGKGRVGTTGGCGYPEIMAAGGIFRIGLPYTREASVLLL